MGEVIAVLSGKGGTGKTSMCAGLGCALAELGKLVLCVDLDIGLRNLDIALGMAEEPALAFPEVIPDKPLKNQAAKHPSFGNLQLLTAPALRPGETVDRNQFWQFLQKARKEYDFVLLDAPAGLGEGFRLSAENASRCILVSGADPASLRDVSRTVEVLELMGKEQMLLLVNRANEKMYRKMHLTVDDLMDGAGLPLLGVAPEDPGVPLAAAFGQPLLRQSRKGAAAACRRMARRLLGQRCPMDPQFI